MNDALHPARSPEFLSRLHDGEIVPAEARAFEAHLAACAECRAAAEGFERALAAIRAEPDAVPPPDLPARILRKIREQSPSRRPFGVTFGIDIRWAGLLAAALLAVLISAPLLLRRPAPPDAIPARIVSLPPEAGGVRAPELEGPAEAPRPEVAPRQAPAAKIVKDEAAPRSAPANEAPASPPAALAEQRAPAAEAPVAAIEAPRGAGLIVLDADGLGPPPSIAHLPPAERLAPLRAREFTLVVGADGRVQRVLEDSREAAARSGRSDAATAEAKAAAAPGQPLAELVFEAGERPRRLIVRVP